MELSNEEQYTDDSKLDSDEDNIKPSEKGKFTPSGKGRYEVIANLVLKLTMIVMVQMVYSNAHLRESGLFKFGYNSSVIVWN